MPSVDTRPEISLKEVQALELEMLKALDTYCRKHRITYCLCGGTLLGAVRHKGFIPWDDDVDLFMPREDYERFHALTLQEPVAPHLRTLYPGDAHYPYAIMKLVDDRTVVYERNITDDRQRAGISLDVFPLDKMYSSRWRNLPVLALAKLRIQLAKVNAKMVRLDRDRRKRAIRTLIMALLKPFSLRPYEKQLTRIDRSARKVRGKGKHMLGNLVWPNRWHDLFPEEAFSSYPEMEFEGEKFPVPVGYEIYLTNLYGDYRQIPKEEDRVAHSFRAYWKKPLDC